jgi:hypothetical protein
MALEVMEDWHGCVWEHHPGELSKRRSMLAMDAFHDHLSDRIRDRLRNKNTDLMLIPSAMTSKLRSPDVSINKPLKHLVQKHYEAWLNKDNHILMTINEIKSALASIIVEWISKSWKDVPVNIISKSISKRCLSNVEDGTQDNNLWGNSEQSGKGACLIGNETVICGLWIR